MKFWVGWAHSYVLHDSGLRQRVKRQCFVLPSAQDLSLDRTEGPLGSGFMLKETLNFILLRLLQNIFLKVPETHCKYWKKKILSRKVLSCNQKKLQAVKQKGTVLKDTAGLRESPEGPEDRLIGCTARTNALGLPQSNGEPSAAPGHSYHGWLHEARLDPAANLLSQLALKAGFTLLHPNRRGFLWYLPPESPACHAKAGARALFWRRPDPITGPQLQRRVGKHVLGFCLNRRPLPFRERVQRNNRYPYKGNYVTLNLCSFH